MAETIKHGIIDAPDLFAQIAEHGPTSLAHMVAEAVRVKVRVVEEDPFEQGRRAVLNLGHTFGHAIEQVSEFSIRPTVRALPSAWWPRHTSRQVSDAVRMN